MGAGQRLLMFALKLPDWKWVPQVSNNKAVVDVALGSQLVRHTTGAFEIAMAFIVSAWSFGGTV